jgi:DNA polymerase-3 subunit alpha
MWGVFGKTEIGQKALANTLEVAAKVEIYELDRSILLPAFPMPEEFTNQDDYLKYLTYEGAKASHRYPVMTPDIQERLDFELTVIRNMGFAGYFLIVQDFIAAARGMDVSVGPGRGSAAGSAVAFCVGITNVDPIKYKLLFERFLNPERVSMPDIDIDFDDDGRASVMDWVVQKYGADRVAQIITYGTMAAKSAIKDVARVLKLPLPESDRLSKLVPDGVKVSLKKAFEEVPELAQELKSGEELVRKTLTLAKKLEGSIRQTGVHACGVIIGPEALMNHIPLSTAKDSVLPVTQYDGKYVESVGMLKMDFLGLKTLSIISDAIKNVKLSRNIDINTDEIPIDDLKTFELYQRGDTVGTFQFESEGMRKHLRDLKPNNLEDLFAMNALYRPGPMDFIPVYIRRKHGHEPTEYPHPMLEGILKDTYGIMIYQEQIMQAAQIMGGFTLGGADLLRRAMGKKKIDEMQKLKAVFVDGAEKLGVKREDAESVFGVMEKFASYGFNRSHSAAYSIVAYHTGYLKANYPAEYMAAVLSRNITDIKKISTFMDEARRMQLPVLGPDVNESYQRFMVNKKGAVRFGMVAIKGVGEAAVDEIIRERKQNGAFKDIFDFIERVNLHSVNKKAIEALAIAGAFDSFGLDRAVYFGEDNDGLNFIEQLSRYGNLFKNAGNTGPTLFGGANTISITRPEVPRTKPWPKLETLNRERELVGIFLSAHPLDDFKLEMQFVSHNLTQLEDLNSLNGKDVKIAGMVTAVEHRTTKTGKAFGTITLEDYQGTYKFVFFSKDYSTYREYMLEGNTLYISAKIQPRPFGENRDLEVKINSICYLADIKQQKVKSLALKISIDDLTDKLIAEVESMAEMHKGNTELEFVIWDPATKVWIRMFSRNFKVEIDDSFLSKLEKLPEISYKIF